MLGILVLSTAQHSNHSQSNVHDCIQAALCINIVSAPAPAGCANLQQNQGGPEPQKINTKNVKRLKERNLTRLGCWQMQLPVVALVGYTNSGKSTLLNRLTAANILAEDQLFATLDPTTRRLDMPSSTEVSCLPLMILRPSTRSCFCL